MSDAGLVLDLARARARLLDLLVTHSFRYSETASFPLASGRLTHYYINCKETTFLAEALPLVGALGFERLRGQGLEAVGGLSLGADPIATAIAFTSQLRGEPLQAFSVRKEPKDHGLKRWVEGYVRPGASVAILEDVMTTGASALKAIRGAEAAGLEVRKVLVLVDREEGGDERSEILAKYPTDVIYRRGEVLAAYARQAGRDVAGLGRD
jgi:orotate phosphoribosyltransferase